MQHPIKGIALTSCSALVPSYFSKDAFNIEDISNIAIETIQDIKTSMPTYKQLYDKIYEKTENKELELEQPNGTKPVFDYYPTLCYDSDFVNPENAKFLEPFP